MVRALDFGEICVYAYAYLIYLYVVSIYLFIYLSIYLSIYISIYLSIFQAKLVKEASRPVPTVSTITLK